MEKITLDVTSDGSYKCLVCPESRCKSCPINLSVNSLVEGSENLSISEKIHKLGYMETLESSSCYQFMVMWNKKIEIQEKLQIWESL